MFLCRVSSLPATVASAPAQVLLVRGAVERHAGVTPASAQGSRFQCSCDGAFIHRLACLNTPLSCICRFGSNTARINSLASRWIIPAPFSASTVRVCSVVTVMHPHVGVYLVIISMTTEGIQSADYTLWPRNKSQTIPQC